MDQAIASTDLSAGRKSWWWGVFNAVQWLALLTALAGFAWLGVLAALGYLQLPVPEVPRVEGWPVPTVMIAGGVLLGIVLAIAARFIVGAVGASRSAVARKRLTAAVAAVAEDIVVAPVEREVGRLAKFTRRSRPLRVGSAGSAGPRGLIKAKGRLEPGGCVADFDHGAKVAGGGGSLVLGLRGEFAERAVKGAAGGGEPGQGFRAQPGELGPVQGAA